MTAHIPVRAIAGGVAFAETIAAAKTMALGEIGAVIVGDEDRGGVFVRRTGNRTVQIAADPQEGIYWAPAGEDGSAGCFARQFSGKANVRWFGAKGDGITPDLTALNASTALCRSVFVPDGSYLTDAPWVLPDQTQIVGESLNAEIVSTSSSSAGIIEGSNNGSGRNFWLDVQRIKFRGNGATGFGMDLNNWSYARSHDVWINDVNVGMRHGGAGQAAFYIHHSATVITEALVGIRNGALGNELNFYSPRIGSVDLGTDDSLNSGTAYYSAAVEVFGIAGHRIGNGGATLNARFFSSRLEGGPLGFDIKAGAQDTWVVAPGVTAVTTEFANSGIRTVYLSSVGTLLNIPTAPGSLPNNWLYANGDVVTRV